MKKYNMTNNDLQISHSGQPSHGGDRKTFDMMT
jgi:hypothetical protein